MEIERWGTTIRGGVLPEWSGGSFCLRREERTASVNWIYALKVRMYAGQRGENEWKTKEGWVTGRRRFDSGCKIDSLWEQFSNGSRNFI